MKRYLAMIGVLAAMAVPGLTSQAAEPNGEQSIWNGVYTEEQAERGRRIHQASCASCHGTRLDGAGQPDMPSSPAIARAPLLRKWKSQPLVALYSYTRATMPVNTPGSLTDQQYIDAIAYMLKLSNVPAGDTELPAVIDTLSAIMIKQDRTE